MVDHNVTDEDRFKYRLKRINEILGVECRLVKASRWVVLGEDREPIFESLPNMGDFIRVYAEWLAPRNGGIPY